MSFCKILVNFSGKYSGQNIRYRTDRKLCIEKFFFQPSIVAISQFLGHFREKRYHYLTSIFFCDVWYAAALSRLPGWWPIRSEHGQVLVWILYDPTNLKQFSQQCVVSGGEKNQGVNRPPCDFSKVSQTQTCSKFQYNFPHQSNNVLLHGKCRK